MVSLKTREMSFFLIFSLDLGDLRIPEWDLPDEQVQRTEEHYLEPGWFTAGAFLFADVIVVHDEFLPGQ